MTMIVFLDGRFVEALKAKVSIFDHGFLYGDGVYETLRTYGGKIWQLDEHLRRLTNSAKMLGLKLPVSRAQIGEWVREVVRRNESADRLKLSSRARNARRCEWRMRITLTRGQNSFDFLSCKKPTLVIAVQKLKSEPQAIYRQGVLVVTVKMERFLPEAKTISLLPFILARRGMARKRAYEGIFVDARGYVREGTITNVFMVKDGVLWTPKSGILPGTTREVVLKIVRGMGGRGKVIPAGGPVVRVADFKLAQLYAADEVFLTNAPRGIIPVREIDGRKIGRAKTICPGPITRKIQIEFAKKILGKFRFDNLFSKRYP